MKKIILLFIFNCMLMAAYAQPPQGFNYQAVARDAAGAALNNQGVGLQISILQGSATGTAVYTETHAVTSNNLGLINIVVGNGTATTGTFSAIDWSMGPYFIEISMDATGGTSYALMGTQQLMSVPYALYAANAGGSMGVTGATGAAGMNGIDGATGATGAAGINGTNGINGTTGATGTDGINGTNGIDGATGATGAAGINGTNGTNGVTGATGANGTAGTNGTNGINGATGATGIAGTNGTNGINGNNGATGATGAAGTNGTNGTAGINGATGTTGLSGSNGTDGATGATGSTGVTGLLTPGTVTGNTPYWDGSDWVTNSNNISNDGFHVGIGGAADATHKLLVYDNSGYPAIGVNASKITIGDVNGNAFGNYFSTNFETAGNFSFMGGNVGIGTSSPTEVLDITSGNVKIPAANDYRYASAKTHYLSVSAVAFQTEAEANYERSVISGSIYIASGNPAGVGYLDAPVSLPDGATVTSVAFYVVDNDGTYNLQAGQLCRNDASTSTSYGNSIQMANVPLPASTNSTLIQAPQTSSITSPVIDNQNYTYYLRWGTMQANPNLRLVKVLITYTVNKAG